MDTITRTQAQDQIDDLRAGLAHSPACVAELPRPAGSCDGCQEDHYLSRVVRDLWDGEPLETVILTAKHIGQSLSYDLDRQVHAIVRATQD